MLWFVIKVVICIFVFVWLRGTLPRLRYDQFMPLGWKLLIPINLVWIMAVATMHILNDRGWPGWKSAALVLIPVLLILLVVFSAQEAAAARRRIERVADDEAEARLGPAFPVPPMDLRVPRQPRLARAGASRAPAAVLDSGDDQRGDDVDG